MRITLHLDTFNRTIPCPYAVLWLDPGTLAWQREGYVGLDLPECGALQCEGDDVLVCGFGEPLTYCVLEALARAWIAVPPDRRTGIAQWCGSGGLSPGTGHWHIQHAELDDAQAAASECATPPAA